MPNKYKNAFSTLIVVIILGIVVIGVASVIIIKQKQKINNGQYDNLKRVGVFNGALVKVPSENTLSFNTVETEEDEGQVNPDVLGKKSKNKEKRIEIDLSKQKLYAYEGSKKKYSFLVSTGKWNRTPTGEFRIYTKLKYTTMSGGNKEWNTYYYLPNVPFTMYFYKDFGIHGTYWHDNFGHPMSHGCINMKTEEAEKLFYWANPPLPKDKNSIYATEDNKGTKVIIYGTTPKE